MTTNTEILNAIQSQNATVGELSVALMEHIAAQKAQDVKLDKLYSWVFVGNGESGKSQVLQNSKFRRWASKIGTAMLLILLGESVAIAFFAIRQYIEQF